MVPPRSSRGPALAVAVLALAVAAASWVTAAEQRAPGPPPPQWVSAVGLRGRVMLTWIPSPDFAAVRVYRRTRTGRDDFVRVGETAGNSFADAGADPGTEYVYRLAAVDAAGREGRPSAEAPVRVPGSERRAPAPPRWEGSLRLEDGIGLKWSHREGEDVIAVNVFRQGPDDPEPRLVGSVQGTSFLDRDVRPGSVYRYWLTALDSSFQETPRSEELAVSLEPPKPPAEREAAPRWAARRSRVIATVAKAAGLPFFRPSDVAVGPRTGNVYLADAGNNRVVVLDRDGTVLRVIGGDPKGQVNFTRLLGVAVDAEEHLYGVDAGAASVLEVDPRGGLVRRVEPTRGFPEESSGLVDAAVAPDGRLLVVDNLNRRVLAVGTGGRVTAFGTPGGGPGELAAPTFCATDTGGRLLVADALNGRVVVFGAVGEAAASFGRPGLGAGGFGRPKGVALGPGGEIWVTDSWLNAVTVFDAEGRFLAGLADEQGRPLDLGSPNGIALDGRGRIFVAERLASRLSILEVVGDAR